MDTKGFTAEYRLAHWAGIVREREESGLSIRAYCKQAGFHENNYFYWQRKLRDIAYEEIAEIQNCETELTPIFAEVKLPAMPGLPEASGNKQAEICVETDGLRITASREYPVSQLAELLKAVTSACC